MVKKNKHSTVTPESIDCACLIHDTQYGWEYVERLYNSLCRHLTPQVRMHVYTEDSRNVPAPFIKHTLEDWPGIRGPKKSWWYKIQLFNSQHHNGPMLYFDLDTVIVGNIDWIWKLPTNRLWAPRDFKYLFKSNNTTINSSIMWWDTSKYDYVYRQFDPTAIAKGVRRWHGDQDYIHENIPEFNRAYMDQTRVRSWRWEIKDGGYNFKTRQYVKPGTGTILDGSTSVLIFHGSPKPHEIEDPAIQQYWQ